MTRGPGPRRDRGLWSWRQPLRLLRFGEADDPLAEQEAAGEIFITSGCAHRQQLLSVDHQEERLFANQEVRSPVGELALVGA